jgi:hypothetical protein
VSRTPCRIVGIASRCCSTRQSTGRDFDRDLAGAEKEFQQAIALSAAGKRGSAPSRHPSHRDAMPSSGAVEFWGILRLILDRVNGARWWPRVARLGDLGGEPKVSQDSLDHRRLVNQRREAQPPTAARTGQDVDAKCPPHQLGPLIRASPGGLCAARVPVFRGCLLASIDSVCDPRNDRPAPQGTRREHTVVQHEVDPRPWRQHGQPFQQLQRIEAQMRRAIRPAVPQRQPDLTVTGPVQPLLGQGRAQRVAAHALQPIAVAGSNHESGVQIEPVGARVTGPQRGRRDVFRWVAAPAGTPWTRRPSTARRRRSPARSGRWRSALSPGTYASVSCPPDSKCAFSGRIY